MGDAAECHVKKPVEKGNLDVGNVQYGKGTEQRPAFLPQKLDCYPAPQPEPMGPDGPWATGRMDGNTMTGTTCTRPVVDHYSIPKDVGNVQYGKGTEPRPAFMPQKLDCYPASQPEPIGPVGPLVTGKMDENLLARTTGTRPVVDNYSIPKDVGKVEYGKGTEPRPAFLPQKLDSYPAPQPEPMGPVGPWATGKVDWNPMAGITGTRPVVDHYSITRYSDGEWRKHNEEVLCCTADDLHRVNMADYNSRRGLESISAVADKTQEITTNRLKERSSELLRWKTEVEQELRALVDEVRFLAVQRRRAIQARNVLGLCRSINGECLTRRGFRDGYDLARDKVEDELIKEAAMIAEIKMLISNTIRRIDEQQAANKSMKGRLEGDWSDRNEAFILTNQNINLKNESPTILFRAAAARFPEHQSTEEGWEKHTRELLGTAAAVRGQSAELRALLNGPILQDAMRDLKQQAETVDITLARGIADLEQCINAMHQELAVVVRRNAESETLISDLQQGIRGLDKTMKVAQTRLDNYQMRPSVENCRDKSMFSLMDEVKSLGEQSTSMKGQLQEAEEALLNLINSRSTLEKELKNKLKTLDIDRNRCQACRSQYPTATAMSGF